MMLIVAALILALPFAVFAGAYAYHVHNFHKEPAMPVDQNTTDTVAQLAAAQTAYDTKLAAEAAKAVAPVQASLDTANATIATRDATIADNAAAVKAAADKLTADSAPVPAPTI